MKEILSNKELYIFDMDGTIYLGYNVFDFAVKFIKNLRAKLEELNNYTFSDDEWKRFFNECIANTNDGIVEKTRKIQEDNIQILKTDAGFTKNICVMSDSISEYRKVGKVREDWNIEIEATVKNKKHK